MTPLHDRARTLQRVCEALAQGDRHQASEVARREYPFEPQTTRRSAIAPAVATSVFLRDGFIDRYSGTPLVFPGALRLLSHLLPEEFPAHPNWKMAESHIAFWELFPTVDHLVPVARGGSHNADNWMTTSMVMNSAKANWTLEELGWRIWPPGDPSEWDGLVPWFLSFITRCPEHLQDGYIKTWHAAAARSWK